MRHWLRTGKLRGVRPGRRRLVERSEFERFLAGDAKEEYAAYKTASKGKDSRDGRTILEYLCRRFPSMMNDTEVASLLENDKSGNAQNRVTLLDNPPPKMLAELTEHGYWRFPKDLEAGDRAVLETMLKKYATRVTGDKPCLTTTGTTTG